MKVTIRNTKVRNDRGQMVNATFLGAGSIEEEVDSWLTEHPDAIADGAAQGVSDWLDENITQPTTPVVDTSLSVSGAAADSKKVGDEISELKSQIDDIEGGTGSGLTTEIKQALMNAFNHVVWDDDDPSGQTYITALQTALYPPIVVTAITLSANSLSFGTLNSTQQLTATTTPVGGEVTWSSSNTSVAAVSETGLVTAVAYGNATITATSGNVSATCSVAVAQATLTSISAVYTQSGTVFDTDTLDDLKNDLVVTAHWSNETTSTLAETDYTLSGNLNQSQSTITVTYGGQSTTFTVNVAVPVFDYLASRDGLLSELSGITKYVNNANNWSESITSSGSLRIEGTGTNNDYLQFKIGENPITATWRMRINFEITYLGSAVTDTSLWGLRPQISDGTNGARVGFGKNGKINAFTGAISGTPTTVGTITIGDSWHDLEVYINTATPIQRITLDDTVLLESASLASGFANNSVFFSGNCRAYIKSIKLYNQ